MVHCNFFFQDNEPVKYTCAWSQNRSRSLESETLNLVNHFRDRDIFQCNDICNAPATFPIIKCQTLSISDCNMPSNHDLLVSVTPHTHISGKNIFSSTNTECALRKCNPHIKPTNKTLISY
jgi:hypothetical protein